MLICRKAEPACSAREENRKKPGRRFLPYEGFYLFHSELAGGAGQRKAEGTRLMPTLVHAMRPSYKEKNRKEDEDGKKAKGDHDYGWR